MTFTVLIFQIVFSNLNLSYWEQCDFDKFFKGEYCPCLITLVERKVIIVKGCGMGRLLVLVSSCFRRNVVPTCKIGSFLCNLDNLLQKNLIVFFFGNQISKWRSFEKRAVFDLLTTFLVTREKLQKICSAHISLTYIHVFCSPYWLFLPYQIWKKNTNFIRDGFSLVWVLVLILIRTMHTGTINK